MNTLFMAIDGACRRNGKPDCIASGGVFVVSQNEDNSWHSTLALSDYETNSTNQRGELLALKLALSHAYKRNGGTANIITDSEYIFNTVTKEWYVSWSKKGWITSTGSDVKNKDLWIDIAFLLSECKEIMMYHIKGHCVSLGKVTALRLLELSETGLRVYCEASLKVHQLYENADYKSQEVLNHANDLSEKNNGFRLDKDQMQLFIAANTAADVIATKCVEDADNIL